MGFVLADLVLNAVQAIEGDGYITVRFVEGTDMVRLEFDNSGPQYLERKCRGYLSRYSLQRRGPWPGQLQEDHGMARRLHPPVVQVLTLWCGCYHTWKSYGDGLAENLGSSSLCQQLSFSIYCMMFSVTVMDVHFPST